MRRATHARLSPAWRAVKWHLSAAILASASRNGASMKRGGRPPAPMRRLSRCSAHCRRNRPRKRFLPRRCAQGVLFELPSDMTRPSRTQTSLWSGAPCRNARLASRSHGPTGSPSRLIPSHHTLTRSFSSKAKVRHGMPWSRTAPSIRKSSSSRSRPGDRRTGGSFAGGKFADLIETSAAELPSGNDEIDR
jgi:hypothetical protein